MNATCLPLSIACSAASAATIVLPEPTSPCSSRCIGVARRRSCAISRHTRSCARVSLNGTRSSSVRGERAGAGQHRRARAAERAFRCAFSDSCCARSSSNLRRVHAGCVRASSARCVSADKPRRRRVQEAHGVAEFPQLAAAHELLGQRFRRARRIRGERALDQLAQRVLRESGRRRIDRRQAIGQRRVVVDHLELRMHDLEAEITVAHVAEHAHARARRQRLLLARIEREEAQHERRVAALRRRAAGRRAGAAAGTGCRC